MINQNSIDKLRKEKIPKQRLLIGDEWIKSLSGEQQDVISPIDGTILTSLEKADEEDVNTAVLSSRKTFERGDWALMPPLNRKKVMLKIADLIEENMLELAVLGVRDNGTEINMALKAEPGSAAEC